MPTEVEGSLSTFGNQVLSTKPSQPHAKIGTSGRQFEGERQFEFKQKGATSQGVFTQPLSGFGKQITSSNVNAPSQKFGQRYASENDMMKQSRPGPGTYGHTEAVGKQVQSQNPSNPNYRIGTGSRWGQYTKVFKDDFKTPPALHPRLTSGWLGDAPTASFHGKGQRADVCKGLKGNEPTFTKNPGPGAYEPPSSLGSQADSRKPNNVRSRIGTASRDQQRNAYISPEHEKDRYGIHSPAPGVYNPKLTASSKIAGSSNFKFGSGDRFSQIKSDNGKHLKVWTPGPGAYVV
eukprot:gene25054-10704_t